MPSQAQNIRALLSPFHTSDWNTDTPSTLRHVSGVRVHVDTRQRRIGQRAPTLYWSLSAGHGLIALVPQRSNSVMADMDAGLNPGLLETSRRGRLLWTARLIRLGATGGQWTGRYERKTRVVFYDMMANALTVRTTVELSRITPAMITALDLSRPDLYGYTGIILDVPVSQHARMEILAQAAHMVTPRRSRAAHADVLPTTDPVLPG